jgi:pyridoxal 5'-phosphate synthase pdxT subunit
MAATSASEPDGASATSTGATPLIGVLALQGDFQAHERVLRRLRARVREVRVPGDLEELEGLVIPGGESTTMMLGVQREGLTEPLRELARDGLPVLGSCAGLIMLDRQHLGLMDIRAERNAFGRQVNSFEADVEIAGLRDGPIRGLFIRAPWIAEHGPDVEILAAVDGHAIAARQGRMLAVAFHSELGEDDRVHRLFLEWVRAPVPVRRRTS